MTRFGNLKEKNEKGLGFRLPGAWFLSEENFRVSQDAGVGSSMRLNILIFSLGFLQAQARFRVLSPGKQVADPQSQREGKH